MRARGGPDRDRRSAHSQPAAPAAGYRFGMHRSPARPQGSSLPSAAIPVAIIALAVVAAFGAYLRFVDASPLGIDSWWHGVAAVTQGSAPYAVAVFCAEIGAATGVAATGALGAALLLVKRRPRDAAALATALVLGVLASELFKSLVLRPRPGGALYPAHGSSYPSGHSMGAAALAVSVALVVAYAEGVSARTRRFAGGAAVGWVVLMMWSRTALGVHWLSDTIGGALLGIAAAILARALWTRPAPRLEPARAPS